MTHHPHDDTLARIAAGALSAGPRFVVATHLAGCAACRKRARAFEAVGGVLLEEMAPVRLSPDAFARTLGRLEEPGREPARRIVLNPEYPAPLDILPLGRWRYITPALQWRNLKLPHDPGANLIMIKAAPGQKMPHHGHRGEEYTQVLTGSFSDRFGHYDVGDLIEMDSDIEHQPIVDAGHECVILASVEGRMRLTGWIAHLMQPLMGL